MLVRDLPRWLRGVLVVTIFLFLINAIIFLVGVVAIVALIQTSPVASGVIGAVLGAAFTYAGTKLLDRGGRQNETRDVTESLYNEIAERAARCLNDHLIPWRDYKKENFDRARVAKFKPVAPVVYPGVASKLGLLHPIIASRVLLFYTALDAIEREIEDAKNDFPPRGKHLTEHRKKLVADRFRLSLEPALDALETLSAGVRYHPEIDQQVALVYPWVRETDKPLRVALIEAIKQTPAPFAPTSSET